MEGFRRLNLKVRASEAATRLPLNLLRPLAVRSTVIGRLLSYLLEEYDVAPFVSLPKKLLFTRSN